MWAYRSALGDPGRRGAWRAVAWALGGMAALGCVRNARLDQQVDQVGQLLLDAEASGALRCAPRELAIARSHLEFAELERAQGFSSKAERHLWIADQHARTAQLLSPAEQCRPRRPETDGSSP